MKTIPFDDGGPAFPQLQPDCINEQGMTLLDYFAGQALAGLLSYVSPDDWIFGEFRRSDLYSATAYDIADAMIHRRNQ